MFHYKKLTFEKYTITWLNDADGQRFSETKLFPDLTPELIKQYKLENGVESSVSVFLLECEGKKALFDTGLGLGLGGKLLERLKELNVNPENIDYIFITHFHLDHIGGLIDLENKPTFKNAKIYVSKDEYDGWINKMSKDKNELQVKVMGICKDNLVQFDFGQMLPLDVKAVESIGHTPGHACYLKDKLIIIGDLMHGMAFQIDHPEICPTYDMDTKQSVVARKKILNLAKSDKLLMGGMHLPCPSFCNIYGDGK